MMNIPAELEFLGLPTELPEESQKKADLLKSISQIMVEAGAKPMTPQSFDNLYPLPLSKIIAVKYEIARQLGVKIKEDVAPGP